MLSDRLGRIFVYIPKVLGKRRQHFATFTRRINVREEKYRARAGNKPASERDSAKREAEINCSRRIVSSPRPPDSRWNYAVGIERTSPRD